jgi:hypothetical protein
VVMPKEPTAIHLDMLFHPGGSRTLRRLPTLLPRPGAAGGAAPSQGRRGGPRDARFLRRGPRGRSAVAAGVCRRVTKDQPGEGAMDLGLQPVGAPSRCCGELPAERGHAG